MAAAGVALTWTPTGWARCRPDMVMRLPSTFVSPDLRSDAVPLCCAQMWPKVHTQVMTGLILAQLVLTCLFAIKKTVWAPILAAISILGSIIVHLSIVRQFNPPQYQMSYRAATNADHSDEVSACSLHNIFQILFQITKLIFEVLKPRFTDKIS